jgi:hypothetical protein
VAWGRRPQAAALVALLADACRVWDAIVVGEYERAFYGSQYTLIAPLFEHYGVQLWMPEAGGRVDFASEHDEQAMTMLGLSSKREVARTSVRVRTAMASRPGSRADTWAGVRRTGTGSVMPGRTRTRFTPPGAAAPAASNPAPKPPMWCGGPSPNALPGIRWPGSPAL